MDEREQIFNIFISNHHHLFICKIGWLFIILITMFKSLIVISQILFFPFTSFQSSFFDLQQPQPMHDHIIIQDSGHHSIKSIPLKQEEHILLHNKISESQSHQTLNPQNGLLKEINFKHQNPFYCQTGYKRDVFPNPVMKLHIKHQKRQFLVPTAYGFSMFVDSADFTISKLIANTGTWQPQLITLIGNLVKRGDIVLNLGSQVGLQSIVIGKMIQPTGKLFIFQPYSFSYALVKKNMKMNNLEEISKVYQCGASDSSSTAFIEISYGNTGGSQIFEKKNSKQVGTMREGRMINQKQEVKLESVDSTLPMDTVLDFALIDVQKMEVKALRGMKKVIQRSPNLIIMCQWQFGSNHSSNRKQAQQILDFLIERGYKIYKYLHKQGENKNCKLGKFIQFQNVETLFKISMVDLFFFPPHKLPPE